MLTICDYIMAYVYRIVCVTVIFSSHLFTLQNRKKKNRFASNEMARNDLPFLNRLFFMQSDTYVPHALLYSTIERKKII